MATQSASRTAEGESKAKLSLILGIVGLFVFGIILGPIAIIQAGKAEALGVSATAGKVLGWVDTIGGVLGLIFAVVMVVTGVMSGTA